MVLNPIRAKAVEKPADWNWSSYRATSGLARPNACLTRQWILSQFDSRLDLAQKEYRRFVKDGLQQEGIWQDVRGQSILGEDDFVEGLVDYATGSKDICDIPRSQRFLGRPGLEIIFADRIVKDTKKRNEKIGEAIESHGYRQREIADYLGMHFSSISRILRTRRAMTSK